MNKRELLEMAAKAAGLVYVAGTDDEWVDDGEGGITGPFKFRDGPVLLYDWNPLEDDGDCARMEAKIGIDVVWYAIEVNSSTEECSLYEQYNGDKQAARRMASLRVAAEIGKYMP